MRQGLLLYFTEYLQEVQHVGKGTALFWWAGFGITIGGIMGGLICGFLSDKVFQSRRPPVAFIFYIGQALALLALGFAPGPIAAAILIGISCMFIFGVHGMLSGTASMDFGGRKAAATAAGMLDGIQYVAAGLTGFGLGWILKTYGWDGHALTAGYTPHNATIWVYALDPVLPGGRAHHDAHLEREAGAERRALSPTASGRWRRAGRAPRREPRPHRAAAPGAA